MVELGRLEKVALRVIWPDEARDFTPWLANNIDVLAEALGLSLKVVEREKTVGSFSLDILAEDGLSDAVVIENQLDRTDHDHLGKALTYLTNLGAKTAIWITSDPRPEHIKAMAWLNEASPQDISFYLVKVEAYRIGESQPAPVFTKIVEPSREAKEVGQQKEELAQRHVDRIEFWTELLARAKARTPLHANISPRKDSWLGTNAGLTGVAFNYVIRMSDSRVEAYIDRGPHWRTWNKTLFDLLLEQRDEIERDYGSKLTWERLDEWRACRISETFDAGGLRSRSDWEAIQDQMIGAMMKFHAALASPIRIGIVKCQLCPPDPTESRPDEMDPALRG
jgi:hypothetical protein